MKCLCEKHSQTEYFLQMLTKNALDVFMSL